MKFRDFIDGKASLLVTKNEWNQFIDRCAAEHLRIISHLDVQLELKFRGAIWAERWVGKGVRISPLSQGVTLNVPDIAFCALEDAEPAENGFKKVYTRDTDAEPSEVTELTPETRIRYALYNRLEELDRVLCESAHETVEVARATVEVADAMNRAFGPMRNGGSFKALGAGTEGVR